MPRIPFSCHATALRRLQRLPALLLLTWLALLLAGLPAAARAAPAAPWSAASAPVGNAVPLADVDELRRRLETIPTQLDPEDDGRRLISDINAIGSAAERLAAQRSTDLADIDLRLQGLGPAPQKGAPADAPDIAQRRASLTRQRAAIDSELKLARLISVDAEQRGNALIRQRHAQFQAALTSRADSPLSLAFWRHLQRAWPGDQARLQALLDELRQASQAALQPEQRGGFIGQLLLALLLLTAGPWLAERLLILLLPPHLPTTRLRRSLLAVAAIGINLLLIGSALQLAWAALTAGSQLPPALATLERASLRAALYAGFVISLGHMLLARRRPSWRLLPLGDEQARRLAPYPWSIALLTAAGSLVADVNAIVGVSLAAEVCTHALLALLIPLVMARLLAQVRQPATPEGSTSDTRPLWLALLLAALAIAVLAALLALLLGFVALAGLLARQSVWLGVVCASAYLLWMLLDDVSQALLSSQGAIGRHLQSALGLEGRLLDQLAVLVSGLLRLLLLFYSGIALMAPFGTGPDELFRRGSRMESALQIGELVLAPQALASALLILLAGLMAIRLFKRWLSERYFPHTLLEPGMQSSITTLLGYVGGVAVIAAALAGLGISVERIAWVASALSVGIGFGLQAIVQNFISGLILLAERPVRVGDWVKLGDTEGDIRRINVRATEIQQWDRSTVIVPNSEFITKTVRNMTLTGTQGRVQLRLPAPLSTDARRMRELILAAFSAHPTVLAEPAPSVLLDGIADGTLTFIATGWVASPRDVSSTRSDLLFSILDTLRAQALHLSPPASTVVKHGPEAEPEPPPEPPGLPEEHKTLQK